MLNLKNFGGKSQKLAYFDVLKIYICVQLFFFHFWGLYAMKHILYDMGNFLLKKIIFCQVNINFWRGTVEGGHNGGFFSLLIFFHVSDHLKQFAEIFIIETDGGTPPQILPK